MKICKKQSCVYVLERYRVLIGKKREIELASKLYMGFRSKYARTAKLNRQLCSSVEILRVRVKVLNSIIERQELLLIARESGDGQ